MERYRDDVCMASKSDTKEEQTSSKSVQPVVSWEGLKQISYQDLRKDFKNKAMQDFIAASQDPEDDIYLADY